MFAFFLFLGPLGSVSYTHLDVYKRQAQGIKYSETSEADKDVNKSKNKKRKVDEEEEEKKLKMIMMSNKQKKLYKKMKYSNSKKEEQTESLKKKKKQIAKQKAKLGKLNSKK